LLRAHAPYDLITANILARPLQNLAPEISRLTSPGADIILSGLVAGDVQGVTAAYRLQAVYMVRRVEVDGWATLLMRRG
jgi:ribosomal protein L11 methyltransferase